VADSQVEDDRPKHPELFISYASPDLARAEALHARLVAAGFSVWFDRARLNPGCDWHQEIEVGCEAARVILPLMTPNWQKSEWTKYETYASDAVIPVLAEGNAEDVMPPPLRRWNAVALDPLIAEELAWQALLGAIRTKLADPTPERTPRIVDLPYPANPFFMGRDDDLVRIHEELHAAPVAALTQGRVRALAAMGGIGKTTLANEYARRYWRLYSQILWVDARAGLESGLALLFGKLFPGRSYDAMQQPDKAKLVLAELSAPPKRLLVLDNVEDAESVRPWLVRDPTSGCRTLITSRFADWPAAEGIRTIALYVLEPEPARNFLIARTGRSAEGDELAACDALAKVLGYLPLALEQAAAYIAAPGSGVDFAGYLRLHEASAAELMAKGALGSTEYPDAVITTWQMTIAKLSPESRAIQRLCAWYADTPIPRSLIMTAGAAILALAAQFGAVAQPASAIQEELRLRSALMGLARYSMILDANDMTFRFHGLVQAVERVRARDSGEADEARDRALTQLTKLFPNAPKDPTQWPLCRLLLPHQKMLLSYALPDSATGRTARLLSLAGGFLLGSGDAAGALPLFRRALDSREHERGPDHPDTLADLNNLAACMHALGDARGASPLYRRALESLDRVLGPDHPDTMRTANNLANCMRGLGDAAGALPIFRLLLQSREILQGPDDPDTLISVNNLAYCLRALGDAAGALPLYRRSLDSNERVLGPDHPDTLLSVNNLASCMEALGDAVGALPLARRALDSRERVLGRDHPQTLISVNTLAACMGALGDRAGALPLLRRALDGCERVLGASHPETLTTLSDLAACLFEMGDPGEALPLSRRALDSRERVLGATHPQTLASVNNLAWCRRALGDAAGALPLFRRTLERSEYVLGANNPQTLRSVNALAGCMRELGDTAGALPLFRRAADGLEQLYGRDHPTSRTVRANCKLMEREVAAARRWSMRRGDANESENRLNAPPWWRRWFM
jgi:tetratricopeptide (TPR) repeat protein